MRDLPARAAAVAAAINNDTFLRSPGRQHLRQQLVPAILIEEQRPRHMLALEIFLRPRIDPDRIRALAGLRKRHHVRRGYRRLPRDFVAVINGLAYRRRQRQTDENSALPQQRLHGLAVPGGSTRAWAR